MSGAVSVRARLIASMLLTAFLGSLLGVGLAVLRDGWRWGSLLMYSVPMLLPMAVLAVVAAILFRRAPTAAIGGGIASAITSVWYSVILLDPAYNQDANIGMGLYLFFGWLFPLGPAFVLGASLGELWARLRQGRR